MAGRTRRSYETASSILGAMSSQWTKKGWLKLCQQMTHQVMQARRESQLVPPRCFVPSRCLPPTR